MRFRPCFVSSNVLLTFSIAWLFCLQTFQIKYTQPRELMWLIPLILSILLIIIGWFIGERKHKKKFYYTSVWFYIVSAWSIYMCFTLRVVFPWFYVLLFLIAFSCANLCYNAYQK